MISSTLKVTSVTALMVDHAVVEARKMYDYVDRLLREDYNSSDYYNSDSSDFPFEDFDRSRTRYKRAIAVVGAGPVGLMAALFLKKKSPETPITLYEIREKATREIRFRLEKPFLQFVKKMMGTERYKELQKTFQKESVIASDEDLKEEDIFVVATKDLEKHLRAAVTAEQGITFKVDTNGEKKGHWEIREYPERGLTTITNWTKTKIDEYDNRSLVFITAGRESGKKLYTNKGDDQKKFKYEPVGSFKREYVGFTIEISFTPGQESQVDKKMKWKKNIYGRENQGGKPEDFYVLLINGAEAQETTAKGWTVMTVPNTGLFSLETKIEKLKQTLHKELVKQHGDHSFFIELKPFGNGSPFPINPSISTKAVIGNTILLGDAVGTASFITSSGVQTGVMHISTCLNEIDFSKAPNESLISKESAMNLNKELLKKTTEWMDKTEHYAMLYHLDYLTATDAIEKFIQDAEIDEKQNVMEVMKEFRKSDEGKRIGTVSAVQFQKTWKSFWEKQKQKAVLKANSKKLNGQANILRKGVSQAKTLEVIPEESVQN